MAVENTNIISKNKTTSQYLANEIKPLLYQKVNYEVHLLDI